jgi:hypothetical protein
VKSVEGFIDMTNRIQQLCDGGEMIQADCRNINCLTMLSKLVLALVMGIVVMIVLLMS